MNLPKEINRIYQQQTFDEKDREIFLKFRAALSSGEIRSAELVEGKWQVNSWVKKGILVGFKLGKIVQLPATKDHSFWDKDTYPIRNFVFSDKVRLVPGGSSVRQGAFVAESVVMMPPMYINVGAYVDSGSMIDSHALVGSCAQIGKRVHLSAGAQIGGVIEPIGANPVIIEDDVFVGGNCGIFEGVIVRQGAILAAGTIITNSVPIYDAVHQRYLQKAENAPREIPQNAVVVPGSRKLKTNSEISLYCPVIVKYRDAKTAAAVVLEDLLR
jgi:2,3,4,5-tetrahydropyridine-2-carboxylate N-succinyltransferase